MTVAIYINNTDQQRSVAISKSENGAETFDKIVLLPGFSTTVTLWKGVDVVISEIEELPDAA